eukprot:4141947-Prymnesium_polylepis.1
MLLDLPKGHPFRIPVYRLDEHWEAIREQVLAAPIVKFWKRISILGKLKMIKERVNNDATQEEDPTPKRRKLSPCTLTEKEVGDFAAPLIAEAAESSIESAVARQISSAAQEVSDWVWRPSGAVATEAREHFDSAVMREST